MTRKILVFMSAMMAVSTLWAQVKLTPQQKRNDEITQDFMKHYHLLMEPRVYPMAANPDQNPPQTTLLTSELTSDKKFISTPKGTQAAYTGPLSSQVSRHELEKVESKAWATDDRRIDLMFGEGVYCRSKGDCSKGMRTIMELLGRIEFQSISYKGQRIDPVYTDPTRSDYKDPNSVPLTENKEYKPLPRADWTIDGYVALKISARSLLHPWEPNILYDINSDFTEAEWDAMLKDAMGRIFKGQKHELVAQVLWKAPRLFCKGPKDDKLTQVTGDGCGLVVESDKSIRRGQFDAKGVWHENSCFKSHRERIEKCDNESRLTAIPVLLVERIGGKSSENFLSQANGYVWYLRSDGKACYVSDPAEAKTACKTDDEFKDLTELSKSILLKKTK